MEFEVAGPPDWHCSLEVSTTVMISPLFSKEVVYTSLLLPTGLAPLYHWYDGEVPPFVGDAVNITLVPGQIRPAGTAAMDTLTGRIGLTVTL
jgi:hypothetical protein